MFPQQRCKAFLRGEKLLARGALFQMQPRIFALSLDRRRFVAVQNLRAI
jgi:hypothetical protein